MTPEQQKRLYVILPYCGPVRYVSIAAAAMVLIILFVLALHKPKLVDRVSLRLQAGVALIDILFAITFLVYSDSHSDGVCSFIGFSHFFLRHLYCFINLSIVINLQLVFLHEITPSPKLEYLYWGGSLALALLLDAPLYALNYFGYDGSRYCILRSETVLSTLIRNLSITTILILTFIYCLVVVVLIVVKLNRSIDLLDTNCTFNENIKQESRADLQKFMKKLIYRVSLYPFVCMLTQSGDIVYLLYKLINNDHPYEINIWSAFSLAMIGVFNFVAFLFDPTLQIALGDYYISFKAKHMKPSFDNSIDLASPFDNASLNDSKTIFGEERNILTEHLLANTSHY